MLLDLVLGETYETLGLPNALEFLPQDQHQVVSYYFSDLQASQSQVKFFDRALRFLTSHKYPDGMERFLDLFGKEYRLMLHAYLENWPNRHVLSV